MPHSRSRTLVTTALLAAALSAVLGQSGLALDAVTFNVTGADKATQRSVRDASLLLAQKAKGRSTEDLFADARAEYGRLIDTLYGMGYYAPVIHVLVDGREAADIAPLDAPSEISAISVTVETGPQFHFSTVAIGPLGRGTEIPAEFATGEVAASTVIQAAAVAAVDGWRARGYAKADVTRQNITADHNDTTISADIGLTSGPVLRFGPLSVTGIDRMRLQRVIKIAGLPTGLKFSPAALERSAERLRRTGIFSAVTLTEDAEITAPDLLGVTAELSEARRRRYSFGAEIASLDGATITGSWLHRNLFGGGERLTISGEVSNIAAQSSGLDYNLGASIERPATPDPDTTAIFAIDLGHLDEVDYRADTFDTSLGLSHWFNSKLTARAALGYSFSQGRDGTGDFLFRTLDLPLGATWDNRNSITDATRGFYLDATAKPFVGFGTTDNGTRLSFDARGYKSLGATDGFTLAGRIQGGAVLDASALRTPRDDLFYSGGGGTVRGQPYQSLGANILKAGGEVGIGGTTFLGGSVEGRYRLTDKFGLVAFFDAGLVDIGTFAANGGNWQSGAGLGLRYETGFGPIRLDLATPLHGDNSAGLQIYVGLGQAF